VPKPTASEKTVTIREYVRKHPDLTPKDLAAKLKEETKFKSVTNDEVSKIKSQMKAKGELPPRSEQPRAEAVPMTVSEPVPVPVQVGGGRAPAATQAGPADDGGGAKMSVTEAVRRLHHLLGAVGPEALRELVGLIAWLGVEETNKLIDLLQQWSPAEGRRRTS
jgi:hypothetical protein